MDIILRNNNMRTKNSGNEWFDCLIKLQDFYNNV